MPDTIFAVISALSDKPWFVGSLGGVSSWVVKRLKWKMLPAYAFIGATTGGFCGEPLALFLHSMDQVTMITYGLGLCSFAFVGALDHIDWAAFIKTRIKSK